MGDTTTHGFPYPVGTDRVMDGDNAIQALAEYTDDFLTAPPDGLAYDTGWLPMTLLTGYTAYAGYPLVARRIGTRVSLRGAVQWTSGTVINPICTVPPDMRPSNAVFVGTVFGSPSKFTAIMHVNTAGHVQIPSSGWFDPTPVIDDVIPLGFTWLVG